MPAIARSKVVTGNLRLRSILTVRRFLLLVSNSSYAPRPGISLAANNFRPGVYFTADEDATTGRKLFAAKLIPGRGAWLEFETSNKNLLTVKIDRKRKLPVTTLLRAIASMAKDQYHAENLDLSTDQGILDAFRDVDNDPNKIGRASCRE